MCEEYRFEKGTPTDIIQVFECVYARLMQMIFKTSQDQAQLPTQRRDCEFPVNSGLWILTL